MSFLLCPMVAFTNLDKDTLLNVSFERNLLILSQKLIILLFMQLSLVLCPDDRLCTEDEVEDLLCSLDTYTANGHDDIQLECLRKWL